MPETSDFYFYDLDKIKKSLMSLAMSDYRTAANHRSYRQIYRLMHTFYTLNTCLQDDDDGDGDRMFKMTFLTKLRPHRQVS